MGLIQSITNTVKWHVLKGKCCKSRCCIRQITERRLSLKLFLITVTILIFWYWIEKQYCHMDHFFNPYLLAIDSIMKANKIKGFVFYGALLGMIRDKKLMAWDYDIDFAIHAQDKQKLLSLTNEFEALGFEIFTRNEFIWHKLSGDLFKISDPILRLYFTSTFFKYHIEYFEFHDETVKSAKENGYAINPTLKLLNHDVTLLCAATDDPCFEKTKILPLKVWNENDFNVDLLVPNDTDYCLTQQYGADWKIPRIKGWKPMICYQQWNSSNINTFKFLIIVWSFGVAMLYFYQKYIKCTANSTQIIIHDSEKEHLILRAEQPNSKHI